MDVHQLAKALKDANVTPDTMLLTWHLNTMDLTLLRCFMDMGGYGEVLPPEGNCIPLIQFFRPNLPIGPDGVRRFPLKLELLYPVMYPGGELFGLNHEAIYDCKQTREVCIALDELCKPIRDREIVWQPGNHLHPDRGSIGRVQNVNNSAQGIAAQITKFFGVVDKEEALESARKTNSMPVPAPVPTKAKDTKKKRRRKGPAVSTQKTRKSISGYYATLGEERTAADTIEAPRLAAASSSADQDVKETGRKKRRVD